MYTPQQAALELGSMALAWLIGIAGYIYFSGNDGVLCNGHGCSAHF